MSGGVGNAVLMCYAKLRDRRQVLPAPQSRFVCALVMATLTIIITVTITVTSIIIIVAAVMVTTIVIFTINEVAFDAAV